MKQIFLVFIFLFYMMVITVMVTAAELVTVKSCNRSVHFLESPKRAVSHDVNLTEMMLVLGLKDHIAGYTGISGWKKQDIKLHKNLMAISELTPRYPSKEILVAAGTDFFFAGWNYGMKVGGEVTPETLDPYGIKVYELTESCAHVMKKSKASMQDMYNDLLNLGKIFRIEHRAEALVERYKEELNALKSGLEHGKPPVPVFVYDSGVEKPFTAGRYAIPNAMIEIAGGKNIMEDVEKSWTTINWETVVERNPGIILIVNYGNTTAAEKKNIIVSNPAFAELDAVKNDNFVILEYIEVTPGPRNIKAIKKLATAFRDVAKRF